MKVTVNGVISRGVKSCTVDDNGHLIFIMTDNSTVDLGIVVGTGIESIDFKETDSNGNNVYTITLTDGTTAEFTANRGPQGIQGIQGETGEQGDTGVSVTNYQLVSGNHAPGTYDTYRMTLSDGTTFDCKVWNGANGEGSGDMLASIYDSNGKATDIFNYVDNKIASDVSGQINAHNESETAHNDIRTGKQDKITASGLLKGDGAGGVTNAVAGTDYQTPLTTEGAQTLGIDSTPTSGSRNLITSGAVYTSLQNKADTSSVYNKEESISAETRTALNIAETATPDAALAEIARKLSESFEAIESTDYPGCYYRMVEDVVEWVNPPMIVGIEYRTTERYMGKPVYQQVITLGSLPSSGGVSVQIAGMDALISAFGRFADNRHIPSFSIASSSFGFDRTVAFESWSNNVGVMANSSVAKGSTAYCLIKYVKS